MGVAREDPDVRALDSARDRLAETLTSFGVSGSALTPAQHLVIARATIMEWTQRRAENWSSDRSIAGIGEPDTYTVGFATAVLSQIASEDLPWDKPVAEWSRQEMAHLLAVGFEAIEEQRTRVFEHEGVPA
jgi:hypothetical protein